MRPRRRELSTLGQRGAVRHSTPGLEIGNLGRRGVEDRKRRPNLGTRQPTSRQDTTSRFLMDLGQCAFLHSRKKEIGHIIVPSRPLRRACMHRTTSIPIDASIVEKPVPQAGRPPPPSASYRHNSVTLAGQGRASSSGDDRRREHTPVPDRNQKKPAA